MIKIYTLVRLSCQQIDFILDHIVSDFSGDQWPQVEGKLTAAAEGLAERSMNGSHILHHFVTVMLCLVDYFNSFWQKTDNLME